MGSFENWYTFLVPLLWPVPIWVALSQTRLVSLTIFWQLDHFLSTFGKKCIFPFENPKTLRKISKNWCWKCKMSCKLLQMLVILHKMTAGPHKMTAAPRKMTAATHLMFAKDQRGGLRSPPGPQGTPPTPILEKTLVSRNDF